MKLLLLSLLLTLTNLFISFGQDVIINEIMSANETTINDEDGDYSDWIELYNGGNCIVNLSGYKITDDISNPEKWTFPQIELLPDSFLIVFCSAKDRINGPVLHTNFKIDSDGEDLMLTDSLGNLTDHILPVSLSEDISYGRKPDAAAGFFYFDFPSPGKSNDLSNTLHFSHQRGFYQEPFKLSISSDSPVDEIYYSIDGSVPTPSSFLYTDSIEIHNRNNEPNIVSNIPTTPDTSVFGAFFWIPPPGKVNKATTIRARSFRGQDATSKIYTHTFFVDSTIYSDYPYNVISLVTESSNFFNYDTGIYVPGVNWSQDDPLWSGNYYETGDEWERDVHIEYFTNTGQVGFFQDAGVRIHGKRTRRRPEKTLRLYARKEYGKAFFNYPLLPQRDLEKYKRFLLFATFGSNKITIIEDIIVNDLIRTFGLDIMEYRPAIVFLNGEYWGIHSIRDYQNEHYISSIHSINKESIDLLKDNKSIVYGSNEDYSELTEFIQNNDLSVDMNYNFVTSEIDIDNFIDYQITEIFFNNYDWPGSNIKFWKSSELDEKWRWIFFDIDSGFGNYEYNMLTHATKEGGTNWPNPDWSTLFLRKLLQNESFRELFIERFAELLNTTFQSDSVKEHIDMLKNLYELEIERHIFRWGYPANKTEWLAGIQLYLTKFAEERPCIMRDHIMDFFNLNEFDFNCDTSIADSSLSYHFKLFPNPNNGKFTIKYSNINHGYYHIQIINSTGIEVYTKDISAIGTKLNIDVGNLKDGLYFLKMQSKELNLTSRFIILR